MLDLLRRGTYACGTIRNDIKGFPTTLKAFLPKGLLERGDFKVARNGNLSISLWQDTKAITCASTNMEMNLTTAVEVQRKRKDRSTLNIKCPPSIASYNARMGGVERNDQLRGIIKYH